MPLALFLTYLPDLFAAVQSIPRILQFIQDTKANFEAKGEWTADADTAFTAEAANWKIDIG